MTFYSITSTSTPSNRKEENLHEEQKSESVIHRAVGHDRLDREEDLDGLNELLDLLWGSVNFFKPALSPFRDGNR